MLTGQAVRVVGGGIAGLTAATALAQAGAVVTLSERAGAFREVGAGIQVSPNAQRVLAALGLADRFAAISYPSQGVVLRTAKGAVIARLDFARRRPGAVFRFVHRARLVALLEQAAREAGAAIRLGEAIADDPAAGLLVGADGLRSAQRAALNGAETPAFTGQTAWRALIDEPDPCSDAQAQLFMGPGRHLVSYPLGGGLRNIVAVVEAPEWTAEGWSERGDPAGLAAAFAGFGGPVPGWLARVRECGRWGLFRHPVAPRWQDGRRVIIGDAAHPTLPFLAQGACLAIEDAWRLRAHLAARPQAEALRAFEAERRPRATAVVAAATDNARNYHLAGLPRIAAHAALRIGGLAAPAAIFGRYAWVYDYDPVAATTGGGA